MKVTDVVRVKPHKRGGVNKRAAMITPSRTGEDDIKFFIAFPAEVL